MATKATEATEEIIHWTPLEPLVECHLVPLIVATVTGVWTPSFEPRHCVCREYIWARGIITIHFIDGVEKHSMLRVIRDPNAKRTAETVLKLGNKRAIRECLCQ
ncbi:hypothetical protein M406DRAFT_101009 [Cryphonectria parasitica EP155]|uniref:Uncharacterized protein n=1 Tax=Cryphonectria parasitica (strain ATCC 38755 / EP155) TaxID=660469 RepID=A0A9P4YD17_CRYP1|nr:uncharacterized protein M406DRAFT_101009 [Cryphonectria parasitica EP155]KAF3770843.1 hypothetical protein M406DRAFT_101009 [Cryphonectria parasitica EP155]